MSVKGIDAPGFVHGIDEAAVRHILQRHGNDPVPVTPADFQLLPQIAAAPDSIEVETGRRNLTRIVYSKRNNGHTVFVEEIRTG